jgi:hypothetical protein
MQTPKPTTAPKVEPTKEPAPAPERKCLRCGYGNNAVFGEVVLDRYGWWMHASCRAVTEREASGW